MIRVGHALTNLRPGAEWSMSDDDIATIIWHTENVAPVTQEEIDAEMRRLEQAVVDKAAADASARAAAIAHAKSLGFTDEMIAVMYPNLVEA